MTDLTYESGLVRSLARATAAVVEHVLQAQPPEQAEVLLPSLLAGLTSIVVSVRTHPFAVAAHVVPTDPSVAAEPVLLFEIKGGSDAAEESC